MNRVDLDARDRAILARRIAAMPDRSDPRPGDWVEFADGTTRRIGFVTPYEWQPDLDTVQISDGGSWYLGTGYLSYSGGLFPGVTRNTLTLTDETRDGDVWFFHHDEPGAGNGVHAVAPFRVYRCSQAVAT